MIFAAGKICNVTRLPTRRLYSLAVEMDVFALVQRSKRSSAVAQRGHRLPDGRQVSPRKAYEAISGVLPVNNLFSSIHGFQIIQEAPDLVIVNVIAGPNYTADVWCGVEESTQALHPDMRVRVCVVEELELAPGKKFKAIMSRAETPADAIQG